MTNYMARDNNAVPVNGMLPPTRERLEEWQELIADKKIDKRMPQLPYIAPRDIVSTRLHRNMLVTSGPDDAGVILAVPTCEYFTNPTPLHIADVIEINSIPVHDRDHNTHMAINRGMAINFAAQAIRARLNWGEVVDPDDDPMTTDTSGETTSMTLTRGEHTALARALALAFTALMSDAQCGEHGMPVVDATLGDHARIDPLEVAVLIAKTCMTEFSKTSTATRGDDSRK